jgi:hypothetical protein
MALLEAGLEVRTPRDPKRRAFGRCHLRSLSRNMLAARTTCSQMALAARATTKTIHTVHRRMVTRRIKN